MKNVFLGLWISECQSPINWPKTNEIYKRERDPWYKEMFHSLILSDYHGL